MFVRLYLVLVQSRCVRLDVIECVSDTAIRLGLIPDTFLCTTSARFQSGAARMTKPGVYGFVVGYIALSNQISIAG